MVDLLLLEQRMYLLIQELKPGVGLKPQRDARRRPLEKGLKSFDHIARGFGFDWNAPRELGKDIDYSKNVSVSRV